MTLVIGATVAGFNIIRQLGYEEFGELYVVEHPRLPRRQVLHLIPSENSIDLDYRLRFDQECDAAAALWHPNIAGLTDRGEFDDQLWISTEYVDGTDAAELLDDGHLDGMPPRMVIEIMSGIAEALDHAHDHGVLHRYVNPGNIVVGKSPADRRRIVLTGFGVARPDGAHNTLTRAGMFIGTAGFTAPEQLIGEDIDGRADQYALAASAFHLLTGAPPFAHFNPMVVVNRQLNDRAPRPSEIRPDLTDFDAIFARALSPDPVDRFRRCRDFAKALDSIGGTRSHIRATSEVRAASIFRETTANPDAHTTEFVETPASGDPAPTEVLPAAAELSTPAALTLHAASPKPAAAPTPAAAPAAEDLEDHDEYDDYDGYDEYDEYDDEPPESGLRRLRNAAAIGGVIVVVLIAWYAGVKALQSASRNDQSPSSVETTSSSEPTTSSPALIAPPVVIAPPSPPPVAPPSPVATTTPPTSTAPTTSKQPAATTPSETAVPKPPVASSPRTTPSGPNALDTRPAVGMPCGAEGSAAVANTGGPVICAETPGGSAWEPPGS